MRDPLRFAEKGGFVLLEFKGLRAGRTQGLVRVWPSAKHFLNLCFCRRRGLAPVDLGPL